MVPLVSLVVGSEPVCCTLSSPRNIRPKMLKKQMSNQLCSLRSLLKKWLQEVPSIEHLLYTRSGMKYVTCYIINPYLPQITFFDNRTHPCCLTCHTALHTVHLRGRTHHSAGRVNIQPKDGSWSIISLGGNMQPGPCDQILGFSWMYPMWWQFLWTSSVDIWLKTSFPFFYSPYMPVIRLVASSLTIKPTMEKLFLYVKEINWGFNILVFKRCLTLGYIRLSKYYWSIKAILKEAGWWVEFKWLLLTFNLQKWISHSVLILKSHYQESMYVHIKSKWLLHLPLENVQKSLLTRSINCLPPVNIHA